MCKVLTKLIQMSSVKMQFRTDVPGGLAMKAPSALFAAALAVLGAAAPAAAATPPTLIAQPSTTQFPDTTVGGSVIRQLYLTNGGTLAATISSITAAGAGYSVTGGSCGTTLPG